MKRFALLLSLLAVFVMASGQSNKVVTAFNQMKPEYNELDKAKQNIDDAAQHPKTSGEAKTWYYRGLVYYKIYQSKDEKFKNLDPNPLKQAYMSFVKAKEIDIKGRFKDDLVFRLTMSASEFFNKGALEFEQKKFTESLESFETAMAIGQLPYINMTDTGAYYNAGIAADQAGEYSKAIDYYGKTIEYNYGGAEVYQFLGGVHLAKGDTLAGIEVMKQGIEKFPEGSTPLMINVINYYLGKGQIEEAYVFLEKALAKETNNPSLWFVYGIALEKIGNTEKAKEAYMKAVEADPKYFNGWFNLGTLYFNEGVKANDDASNVPLDDKAGYEAAVAKADAFFREALPFYAKAYELEQSDGSLLQGLRTIYYRFKMTEKFEEINKKIEGLK